MSETEEPKFIYILFINGWRPEMAFQSLDLLEKYACETHIIPSIKKLTEQALFHSDLLAILEEKLSNNDFKFLFPFWIGYQESSSVKDKNYPILIAKICELKSG